MNQDPVSWSTLFESRMTIKVVPDATEKQVEAAARKQLIEQLQRGEGTFVAWPNS